MLVIWQKIKSLFLASRQYIVVGAIFLFFVLVNTLPASLDLVNYQIGNGGDSYQNMWNFWWFKTAVIDLHQNPYTTEYLFYPHTASLILHTLDPIEDLISLPLQYLFNGNLVLVFNLVVINCFVMTGIFTYALAYYLVKNKWAAFIASYILTFSPFMMGHGLGHLNLIAIWWIPAFLLCFFKFHESQLWKYVILSSVFLSCIIVTNSYQTFFVLLFVLIYLIFNIFNKNIKLTKDYLFKLLSIFILGIVFVFPFVYSYVTAFFSGLYTSNHDVVRWTPDLVMFFMPGIGSTWIKLNYQYLVAQDWPFRIFRHASFGAENEIYFGYSVLILAGYALFKARIKKTYIWFITMFVFLIMACGVTLKVFGYVPDFKLPYHYIYGIMPLVSVPGRFDLFIVFSLAMISAYAIAHLSNNLSLKNKRIILPIIFIIIFLEFQQVPYRKAKIEVPAIYYELAKDTEDYAIYDLSSHNLGVLMYYQTIHHKKLLNAYISRIEKDLVYYLENEPIISDIPKLAKGDEFEVNADWIKEFSDKFTALKIRYVIFAKKDTEFRFKDITPYFEDANIIVYRIY